MYLSTSRDLNGNPITAIESFAFDNIKSSSLSLNDVRHLRHIQPYSFHKITVGSFTLTGTKIASIPAKTFVNVYTSSMVLSNNEIEEIAPSAFFNVNVTVLL